MSDYAPSVGMARARYCDSIVRKDGVPHSFAVTPEEHAKNHAEFDRMIAEVERAAAEKALTDAARQMPFPADPYGGFDYESLRAAFVQGTNWLRARAEAYRQERGE